MKSKTQSSNINAAWNVFQGKMRILRKKQKEIFSDLHKKAEQEEISAARDILNK